jgi:hypothetical protein
MTAYYHPNVGRGGVKIDLVQIVQHENLNGTRPHHFTLGKITRPSARVGVPDNRYDRCDSPQLFQNPGGADVPGVKDEIDTL